MRSYDHKKIEKKWQKEWEKKKLYRSKEKGKKMYVLDMFPYPSGDGLHVGHPKGYIATDIVSRHARMQGKSVLHPMGWDAFGLPAENYAIKNKVHPRKAVEKNVKRFKEQLKLIGLDYDWSREINTTDPEFYKWTQWIFLKLYEKGLAYQSYEPINWCPSCQTGLANEDLEGNACERCGTIVEKRPMRQWILKITAYAERLLQDLELLPEWQSHIKESQRNWIGKSEGAEIDFPLTIMEGKRVILLHGKGGSASGAFKPWLSGKLEKLGFEVQSPQLPNSTEPNDEEQADFVQSHCTLDEETIIVGHSFGGLVALRLLERGIQVKRVVLLGTPYRGEFLDKRPRPTVTAAIKKGFDFEKIKQNAKFIQLYDTHDHAIPVSDGEAYNKLLGGLLMKVEAQKSHFNGLVEPDVFTAVVPTIRVFTTRPDTLYGVTYMVLSPEHPWVQEEVKGQNSNGKSAIQNLEEVHAYIAKAAIKTEIERQENKEKTGVKLEGVMAINPATGEKIPLYVADYVLANYGTGAIMAVPAHDERDYEFAKKFDIPVKDVVAKRVGNPNVEEQWRNIAIVIIENAKGEVLIQSQDRGEGPVYCWPGGGVDEGEDAETAAIREAREESGYKDFGNIRRLGVFDTHYWNPIRQIYRHGTEAAYAMRLTSEAQEAPEFTEQEKRSIIKHRWVNLDEAERLLREQGVPGSGDLPALLQFKTGNARVYTEEGILVNSGEFDHLTSSEAMIKITQKFGTKKTTYKIRDWVFSRQRYWGEPIPIIHCDKCGIVPVPYKDLPVKLPEVKNYEPTGTGESPLAAISKWVNTRCPNCNGKAKRETNTMPQWAGSSWYWLRYMDPKNKKTLVGKKKEKYWAPVDLYVGGAEHATRHLIYGRFWHKFLQDIGIVSTPEPFTRLISVGLILAEDGKKMSKRYGNVINPDDIVRTYGADTLRVYEMFMGPFTDAIAWKTAALIGARRFLERIWRLQEKFNKNADDSVERELHKTIKKVGDDIANFKFNTAISQMMIFVNAAEGKGITKRQYLKFISILAPFAPHIAEELWREHGNRKSVHLGPWPKFDAKKLIADEVAIMIQVNGRIRAQTTVSTDSDEATVRASAEKAGAKWLEGKRIRKVIFVPNRLMNFVVD